MSAWPSRLDEITSFDGGTRKSGRVVRPDRYRFWDSFPDDPHFIPRGGGYSYAAASFGSDSVIVDHRAFNRILGFDRETGRVEVEAGTSLGALYDFLFSRGWHLPTQPGYPAITVGGCIASECHGKNQLRDGCFSRQVASIELFHPRHGLLALSRERDGQLFELTCGGFGLTGCIVTAVLEAKPLAGARLAMRTEALDNVRALPDALRRRAMEADFVYSWHDFNNSAEGPGIVVSGKLVSDASSVGDTAAAPQWTGHLRWDNRGALRVPVWNNLTAPIATALYRRTAQWMANAKPIRLFDCMFPVASRGGPYFRLFGANGFCEFQAIVPEDRFIEFCDAVMAYVRRHRIAITLASAKLFGGAQSYLRFSGTGVCFALDFPRSGASGAFLKFLDGLTQELSLVPSIIKDSRIPCEVVRKAYPEYGKFVEQVKAFDPQRRCRSELSDRLGL